MHKNTARIVNDIVDFAYDSFQRNVPIGDTYRTYEAVYKTHAIAGSIAGIEEASAGVNKTVPTHAGESPEYPLFVHRGTGIFGPHRSPIVSPKGNVMRFNIGAGNPYFMKQGDPGNIFRLQVKGQKPQPYLEDVVRETRLYIERQKSKFTRMLLE
jgi:hypothetical protein